MSLWPLAFIAGAISFSSPCCLPLLPGYLAHIGGLVTPGVVTPLRSRTIAGAALFVTGFTLVFALLGASAGLLGGALADQRELLLRASGWVIVAMAVLQITGWRPALFGATALVPVPTGGAGVASSFPLGMAFAASWTPCVGPVLAAILVAASAEASALEGAGLLTVYALGLGVPFLLSALALERFGPLRNAILRRHRHVEIIGGVVLGVMGVLILTDRWLPLMGPLLRWYAQLNWPPF
ncbi:MAG: cytochrome c biogenesis protein CcdA [Chloroflexota bacterium]|nr:cytochrome c biogenesis protein CcdA [Chloroflexota bacterium]